MTQVTGPIPESWGQDYPPQWDEIVTCLLCEDTSRAQYKRSGYREGTWLCLSRRVCEKRRRKLANIKAWAVRHKVARLERERLEALELA